MKSGSYMQDSIVCGTILYLMTGAIKNEIIVVTNLTMLTQSGAPGCVFIGWSDFSWW